MSKQAADIYQNEIKNEFLNCKDKKLKSLLQKELIENLESRISRTKNNLENLNDGFSNSRKEKILQLENELLLELKNIANEK